MATAQLVRVDKWEKLAEPEAALTDFRREAANKLGYTHGVGLARAKQRERVASEELRLALNAAGVKPFTADSVSNYKKSKLGTKGTTMGWFLSGSHPGGYDNVPLAAVIVIASVIAFIGLGIAGVIVVDAHHGAAAWCFGLMLPCAGIATGLFKAIGWSDKFQRLEWRTGRIENYTGAIPDQALQDALAIKAAFDAMPNKAAGEPHFIVEYLTQSTDPFLSVQNDGALVWFAAWDEHGFKG